MTALLGEPTDTGASGPFSEAEYTKKQIPEPAIFADQLIRDDPGRLVMSDSMPLLDQALWLRPGEPRVVPGVLNGEHAVLFRLGAIVGIVSGVLAAVVIAALLARPAPVNRPEHRHGVMIAYLRSVVLSPGAFYERCHVVFVNAQQRQLRDASIGLGGLNVLFLRMREIFGEALRLDAHGLILAHNHPPGHCPPSSCDIIATRRLAEVARALDIVLIDHLIFTDEAVYSMRAGGLL